MGDRGFGVEGFRGYAPTNGGGHLNIRHNTTYTVKPSARYQTTVRHLYYQYECRWRMMWNTEIIRYSRFRGGNARNSARRDDNLCGASNGRTSPPQDIKRFQGRYSGRLTKTDKSNYNFRTPILQATRSGTLGRFSIPMPRPKSSDLLKKGLGKNGCAAG